MVKEIGYVSITIFEKMTALFLLCIHVKDPYTIVSAYQYSFAQY